MDDVLLVDEPSPKIRRLTLNRLDKRNALADTLRGALSARCGLVTVHVMSP